MNKKVIIQIIKEFWPQTALSLVWAGYKVFINRSSDAALATFVTNFFASLFLLSWFFGQVLRIKKQQKIESEFSKVKDQLADLVIELKGSVTDLIGWSTGGNSYLSIRINYQADRSISHFIVEGFIEDQRPNFAGKFPLKNTVVEIAYLERRVERFDALNYYSSTQYTNLAMLEIPKNVNFVYYYVRVTSLNKSYVQCFMLKKHKDGLWYTHSIRFNDLYQYELRENVLQHKYPEDLKQISPTHLEFEKQVICPSSNLVAIPINK